MGGESEDDLEDAVAAGKRATAALGVLASPLLVFVGVFIAATGALCAVLGLVKHETEFTIFGGADMISAGGACVLAWMPGGHRIWRAWRDVVEKHLVPLHAQYEIASVRVER